MSSTIDYADCPRCGGVLTIEYDNRTFEVYRWCNSCGLKEEGFYDESEDENVRSFNKSLYNEENDDD